MNRHKVSLVRFEKPLESVRRAVELCGGLERIGTRAKVFIKPNIVFWSSKVPFPKWGVITTSRVIEDLVVLLKEHGVDDITIGEGMVINRPGDQETANHAFETLGYNQLKRRYGIQVIDTYQRPFEEVDLGDGVVLNFNTDILHSDFVVDAPVLKTHAQTTVSLAIKNLKGMIDIKSRKRCHSADPEKDLHFWISRLADKMPPILAVLDGIYTSEYGPGFDGVMHRSDILAASWDALSADLVGSRLLGHNPAEVPYLAHAARRRGRPTDLSDVEVVGERIEDLAKPHKWNFPYNEEGTLPLPMAKKGLSGISYYKYDNSLCTYCSAVNGALLQAVAAAWRGEPWDEVEVLTGKRMQPSPGAKKTILLGKCMYQAHKDNPDIAEMIPVKGCPPPAGAGAQGVAPGGHHGRPGLFRQPGHPARQLYEALPGSARVRRRLLPHKLGAFGRAGSPARPKARKTAPRNADFPRQKHRNQESSLTSKFAECYFVDGHQPKLHMPNFTSIYLSLAEAGKVNTMKILKINQSPELAVHQRPRRMGGDPVHRPIFFVPVARGGIAVGC